MMSEGRTLQVYDDVELFAHHVKDTGALILGARLLYRPWIQHCAAHLSKGLDAAPMRCNRCILPGFVLVQIVSLRECIG